MRNIKSTLLAASLLAGMAAVPGSAPSAFRAPSERRQRKPYPTMVVSPQAEIDTWNAAVDAKKAAKRARQRARFEAGQPWRRGEAVAVAA